MEMHRFTLVAALDLFQLSKIILINDCTMEITSTVNKAILAMMKSVKTEVG